MKKAIYLILAVLTLLTAMSITTSCRKATYPTLPPLPENLYQKPDPEPEPEPDYLNVEHNDVILGSEHGSTATLEYTIDTNLEVEHPFVLTLKENPFFSFDGKTIIALKDNYTDKERTDTILVTNPDTDLVCKIPIIQKFDYHDKGELVNFTCRNLKAALVERYDTDGDGEISTEEAMIPEEIDIRGCGATNLDGIGAFKKAWKLDARDNEIVDGTDIKGMRQLYWLDLKGNKNLKTFDITGCTIYFEWIDFEVTDDLKYYILKNQVQKEEYIIPHKTELYCWFPDQEPLHFKTVEDTRETTDWTHNKELNLVKKHTKGTGIPMVLTGMGWIDEDLKDGSLYRLYNDFAEMIFSDECPRNMELYDYVDLYVYTYIRINRNEWPFHANSTQSTDLDFENISNCEKVWGEVYDDIESYFPEYTEDGKFIPKPFILGLDIKRASLFAGDMEFNFSQYSENCRGFLSCLVRSSFQNEEDYISYNCLHERIKFYEENLWKYKVCCSWDIAMEQL